MKNVYDYKIENDTVEAAREAEEANPLPQFEKEVKQKPVSYDAKGNVREDKTMKHLKLALLVLFVLLVNVYVFHMCVGNVGA